MSMNAGPTLEVSWVSSRRARTSTKQTFGKVCNTEGITRHAGSDLKKPCWFAKKAFLAQRLFKRQSRSMPSRYIFFVGHLLFSRFIAFERFPCDVESCITRPAYIYVRKKRHISDVGFPRLRGAAPWQPLFHNGLVCRFNLSDKTEKEGWCVERCQYGKEKLMLIGKPEHWIWLSVTY